MTNQLTNEQVAKCVTSAVFAVAAAKLNPFNLGVKAFYETTLEAINDGGLIEDWQKTFEDFLAAEAKLNPDRTNKVPNIGLQVNIENNSGNIQM